MKETSSFARGLLICIKKYIVHARVWWFGGSLFLAVFSCLLPLEFLQLPDRLSQFRNARRYTLLLSPLYRDL